MPILLRRRGTSGGIAGMGACGSFLFEVALLGHACGAFFLYLRDDLYSLINQLLETLAVLRGGFAELIAQLVDKLPLRVKAAILPCDHAIRVLRRPPSIWGGLSDLEQGGGSGFAEAADKVRMYCNLAGRCPSVALRANNLSFLRLASFF